jgi:hypothetical protein
MVLYNQELITLSHSFSTWHSITVTFTYCGQHKNETQFLKLTEAIYMKTNKYTTYSFNLLCMVAPMCFGDTLLSSGSVPRAF